MTYASTRVTSETAAPYARLRVDVLGGDVDDVPKRTQRYLDRLHEAGDVFAARVHVVASPDDGEAVVALMAYPFEGPPWQALVDWSTQQIHQPYVLSMMREAMSNWLLDLELLSDPPMALTLRLNLDRAPDGLEALLSEFGWRHQGERREFKTPVESLSTVWEGPLSWRTLDEVGLDVAADVFERAGQGPDWETDDDARRLIDEYLSDGELYCERDCVQVGFVNDEPVAFLVAQTEQSSGWCTMTFMGVVASARGNGYGAWVHRRGFELLRRQGGTLYHGGTSAENAAMLALFERHGCVPYVHMSEWTYTFPARED